MYGWLDQLSIDIKAEHLCAISQVEGGLDVVVAWDARFNCAQG